MRVYMVNEGTLRKPQGPCYAFAVFLQLKEVHLFSVKSHCVTANWEYFKSIMNKHKIAPVSKSLQSRLVKGFMKGTESTRLLCLQEILLYAGQGPLDVQKSYTSFTWYDPKYRYGKKGAYSNHTVCIWYPNFALSMHQMGNS